MPQITDPRNGNSAKVSDNGRLSTKSNTSKDHAVAAVNGESFNLDMSALTVTVDTEVGIWVWTNNGTDTIIFDDVFVNLGATTAGSGPAVVTVVRNPTGGTVISDANTTGIAESNRNLGSAIVSGATLYVASASGKTITGGTDLFSAERNSSTQTVFSWDGTIVAPPGTSLGINYTAPSGNTSQTVRINMTYFVPTDPAV